MVAARDLAGKGFAWTPEKLATLAREVLKESDFDVGKAARALARRAEDDATLWDALMRGAVEERALMAVRYARAKANRDPYANAPASSRGPPNHDTRIHRETLIAMKEEGVGLMDTFQLPDGTYLRDATRDQILAAAEFYREQARELNIQARWMRLIAQKLTPGQKVADAFSNERIAELETLAERDDDQ